MTKKPQGINACSPSPCGPNSQCIPIKMKQEEAGRSRERPSERGFIKKWEISNSGGAFQFWVILFLFNEPFPNISIKWPESFCPNDNPCSVFRCEASLSLPCHRRQHLRPEGPGSDEGRGLLVRLQCALQTEAGLPGSVEGNNLVSAWQLENFFHSKSHDHNGGFWLVEIF